MAASRQYGPEVIELYWCALYSYPPLAILCGYEPDLATLFHVVGLTDWQGEAFEQLWPAVEQIWPFLVHQKANYQILLRLLIFLTSPDESPTVSDEVVAAFMPTPQALIEADRTSWFQ